MPFLLANTQPAKQEKWISLPACVRQTKEHMALEKCTLQFGHKGQFAWKCASVKERER